MKPTLFLSSGWIFLSVLAAGNLFAEGPTTYTPVTLLALGDSITAGTPGFHSPAEVPPDGRGNPESQYAYWIHKKHPEWTVLNRGIPGQVTEDILGRTDNELVQANPGFVILMAGVNDIYRGYPAARASANLQAIILKIQARKIPLMLLTVLPFRGMTPAQIQALSALNQWIQSFARQNNFGFADAFSAMRASDNPLRLASSRDGLHPTVLGYRKLGEVITAALEEWFAAHRMKIQG